MTLAFDDFRLFVSNDCSGADGSVALCCPTCGHDCVYIARVGRGRGVLQVELCCEVGHAFCYQFDSHEGRVELSLAREAGE